MPNIDCKKEIHFKCQGSANCCVSRGIYGYVYLSKKDITRLSNYKEFNVKNFIRLYCDKTDGFIHFKEKKKNGDCQFLANKKCSIYKARPTQCRTWPFWKENMNAKTWDNKIAKFCPGISKGGIIKKIEIEKKIKDDENNEIKMLEEVNKLITR